MTRFTERVERDLGQIADRATPSSTAWDAIQQRIAEQDTTESTSEVIMLAPDRNEPPTSTRNWILVAAAIVVLALIGGLIVAGTRSDEDQTPVDEPEVEIEEGAAEPLPFAGSDVEPGTYETDLLGVPLTFNVPETMKLWVATQNRVFLTDFFDMTFSPPPATARTLSFSRISGWNTPAEGIDLDYFGPGSIDPDDIDAWAAANDLDASIPPCCHTVVFGDEVPERVPTRLARRDATPLDVRIDPAATTQTFERCRDDETCLFAASLSDRGTAERFDKDPMLSTGKVNRFWVIHLAGQDPLLLHASAPEGDEAWLDLVDDTVLFDESLPVEDATPADDEAVSDAVTTFQTNDGPFAVASDGTSIWITNINEDTDALSRLNPDDGTRTDFPVATDKLGVRTDALTFDGTSIWAVRADNMVSKVNPDDGTFVEYETGSRSGVSTLGVAFDGTSIWITNPLENTVTKMNPDDGARVEFATGANPHQVVSDGTSIWVANGADGTVSKIDPDDGSRTDYPTGTEPLGLAFDGTSIWVTNRDDDTVSKIDPDDGSRVDFATGTEPWGVAFDGTSIWIANGVDGTVSKMNPDDGSRVDIPTGGIPRFVTFDGTHVWVTNNLDDTVSRITPG